MRMIPTDIWWHSARKAECFEPHPAELMTSLCSTPPIRSWVCGVCASTQRTTHAVAPTCTGGFAYSFTTTKAFDGQSD